MNRNISTLSMIGIVAMAIFALEGCRVEYRHGGGWHRPGHGHRHPPRRHPGRRHFNLVASNAISSAAMELSQDYAISLTSANTILNIANSDNQVEELNAIGLDASDVAPLASLEMPSRENVAKISTALNEDSQKVEQLLSDMISDLKAENMEEPSSND